MPVEGRERTEAFLVGSIPTRVFPLYDHQPKSWFIHMTPRIYSLNHYLLSLNVAITHRWPSEAEAGREVLLAEIRLIIVPVIEFIDSPQMSYKEQSCSLTKGPFIARLDSGVQNK